MVNYLVSYIFISLLAESRPSLQVNDTFDENGRTIELPSGLEQFRMNLVELLVDICQLLGPALFIQKVMIASLYLETCIPLGNLGYGNLTVLDKFYLRRLYCLRLFFIDPFLFLMRHLAIGN